MKVFPDRLQQVLERGLAPAYLVAGPERLLVEESCDAIRRTARAHQIAERIQLTAEARFDWDELGRATETGSLFASRRLVELRLPGGKPGAEGGKAIRGWLETGGEDVLLVICDQWELKQEKAAWVGAIERAGVYVPAWKVKPERLPEWIGRRLASRGLRADRPAIDFLAQRLEGNLLAAAQEVDRLALLFPDARLDKERAEQAVADSARFDVYRLVELVISGRTGPALRCIRGLREADVEPVLVVWALARELEIVSRVARASRSMPLAAALKEAGVWESRKPAIQACLARLGAGRVDAGLARLGELDLLFKGQSAEFPASSLRGESAQRVDYFWIELERLCAGLAADPRLAA